ncbi:MAG: D-alanyl-D-alanine carboxypeptidase/D-alanyl-D-alanine-endopeptidase [Cyanobacteria bacterium]|nr:D-alanyl-D-alanine carboxypeptidase/D-alanyl-D-alanine-endopeptidase [Cyanobacteria bacterium CG_2015-16_32_12]NCO77800.1 D-alanyl-D-alanine carboxypeptidase/D-alanyl-D-alanine-endopeptidase [Cyanobacteria bacterium CG_2015-22_32_23]NCQ04898.1 D-alanyl-D-alanine carboxypeptidase/D-alanyl-D-alanine-endopeptidase [Cyanobacteria bacterium CG_2015-09_32_10]NCS83423.1 D-alanyl-D-alanine carboxypeptidase/D-alanyl-D-alanine-endopeptidase [Cyanobacteria bacterium CG_2015-02_32_10]
MKRYLFSFFSFLFIFSSFPINAQESVKNNEKKVCVSHLKNEIESIINQPSRQQESWGILIESIKNNQVLYQLNSNKYFIPASNAKLLTTSAVLLKLGSDFTIKTPVYIEGKPPKLNSLIIQGKGDPTFTKKSLEIIAQKLKEEGIKEVDNLVLIDGYLSSPSTNYSWEFEDIYFYFAVPVNSLILEENTVNLTLNPNNLNEKVSLKWSDELAGKQWKIENNVYTKDKDKEDNIIISPLFAKSSLEIKGDLPIDKESNIWRLSILNPAQYFQESLVKILNNNGISIKNTEIINGKNIISNNQQLLLEIKSPNLAELIKETNQESNNLYAEVLLKYLGDESLNEWESLAQIMTNLGISPNDYKLKDGSGLSRHNLITPQALVTLLKLMNNSKYQEIFLNSLSIAGENGTLKNRFQNTNIANNLYGKTGTLSGISALSGYLKTDNYGNLVLTIMVNQSSANSGVLRNTIDEIILLLGQLNKC